MSFDLSDLTISYQSISKMTVSDRVSMARTQEGMSFLASLTPSQLAELFPSYFRRELPDLGKKVLSGGVAQSLSTTTDSGTPDYTMPKLPDSGISGAMPSKPSTSYSYNEAIQKPKESDAKPAWARRLEEKEKQEEKKEAPKYRGPSPSGAMNRGLSKLRSQAYAKELQDEGVQKQLAALMKVEVGGMNEKSKLDFLETLVNRGSLFPGKSLMSRLQGVNKTYWGGGIGDPRRVSEKELEEFNRLMGIIIHEGRDETKGATDNASGSLALERMKKLQREGRADQGMWTGGAVGKGEYVYVDSPYAKRRVNYRSEAQKLGEEDERIASTPSEKGEPEKKNEAKESVASPVQVSAPPPPLPEGLNQNVTDYYNKLPDDKKEQFRADLDRNIKEGKESVESINKEASKKPSPATPFEPINSIPSAPKMKTLKGQNLVEKFPGGTPRFFHEGGGTRGLNKKLINVLNQATKDLPPGYHVRMFSGVNSRARTKNHPGGVAIDLKIVDPNGKVLRDRGFGEGHKIYEQLSQSMDIRGRELYPGTKYIWGGAWTAAGGDRMHYQIQDPDQPVRGASPGSGAYSFTQGVNSNFWAGPKAAAQFMSDKERTQYREQIRANIKAEQERKEITPEIHVEPAVQEKAPPVAQRSFTQGHPGPAPVPTPEPQKTETPAPKAPEVSKAPEPTAVVDLMKTEKEVPKFEHGGSKQASGDNALVIGETGKPLFMMNTDKERMSYDPAGNRLEVEPMHRTNTRDLEKRQVERQSEAERNPGPGTVAVPKPQQPAPQTGNPNWDHMMKSMIQSSGNLYETASYHRAVAKSRFIEVGDSVKGGHYSYGASNLKWL